VAANGFAAAVETTSVPTRWGELLQQEGRIYRKEEYFRKKAQQFVNRRRIIGTYCRIIYIIHTRQPFGPLFLRRRHWAFILYIYIVICNDERRRFSVVATRVGGGGCREIRLNRNDIIIIIVISSIRVRRPHPVPPEVWNVFCTNKTRGGGDDDRPTDRRQNRRQQQISRCGATVATTRNPTIVK